MIKDEMEDDSIFRYLKKKDGCWYERWLERINSKLQHFSFLHQIPSNHQILTLSARSPSAPWSTKIWMKRLYKGVYPNYLKNLQLKRDHEIHLTLFWASTSAPSTNKNKIASNCCFPQSVARKATIWRGVALF